MSGYRMRGVKLPSAPEDKATICALIPDDNRISRSMNDIARTACGNQGRQTQDSSDCQSFTDEDSLPRAISQVYPYTQKVFDTYNEKYDSICKMFDVSIIVLKALSYLIGLL